MEEAEPTKPENGPVKKAPGGKPVPVERPERHSQNPKTQSYGGHDKREGAGKANWGKAGEAENDVSIDKEDPIYDSEAEQEANTKPKPE